MRQSQYVLTHFHLEIKGNNCTKKQLTIKNNLSKANLGPPNLPHIFTALSIVEVGMQMALAVLRTLLHRDAISYCIVAGLEGETTGKVPTIHLGQNIAPYQLDDLLNASIGESKGGLADLLGP